LTTSKLPTVSQLQVDHSPVIDPITDSTCT
jgi:hypothetical protein